MDVSVIIVSYNVRSYLINCIRSVQEASPGWKVEIIVVDNASDDQSTEAVSAAFPDVKLIRNPVNVGFGAACNQGVQVSAGRYILFLNPDSLVDRPVFSTLIPYMDANPSVGLTGCKILNEDGTLQPACRRSFPTLWVSFTRLSGLSRLFPHSKRFARYNLTYLDENEMADIDAVSGAFMFVRREAFDQTGGFDEDYFMYGEDLDLCYQVRKAGFRVVYHPATTVIHFKGRSKSVHVDTRYHFYESMKIFARKHGSGNPVFIGLLNLAITFRYLLAAFRERSAGLLTGLTDVISLLILFESLSAIRNGRLFGYPDYAYPVIFIVLIFVQVAVYLSMGVYESATPRRRRVILASVVTWVIVSLSAYFSKDFAFSRLVLFGSFLAVTATHVGYRELIRLMSRVPQSRRVVVLSGPDGLAGSPWFELRVVFQHRMTLKGYLFGKPVSNNSQQVEGLWSDLPEQIRKNRITDVVLDTGVMDFQAQVHWIQWCREAGVHVELLSVTGLKETLLNDILRQPDRTGLVYRLVKRITDWWVIRGLGVAGEGRKEPGKFWIGNPDKARRPAVFTAHYLLNDCFPQIQREEDRYLLTLFYNRFHSVAMDRLIMERLVKRREDRA
ncbi:MAG: glycosyltransferase [Bacteroidetes bacterium]|nr:glycosyltransferase [Bacteroidota bacterium]